MFDAVDLRADIARQRRMSRRLNIEIAIILTLGMIGWGLLIAGKLGLL